MGRPLKMSSRNIWCYVPKDYFLEMTSKRKQILGEWAFRTKRDNWILPLFLERIFKNYFITWVCSICYSDDKALYVVCLDKHLDYCAGRFEAVTCPICRLTFAKSYRKIVADRYNDYSAFITSFNPWKNPYHIIANSFHLLLMIGVLASTLWFLCLIKSMIGAGVLSDIFLSGFGAFAAGFAVGRFLISWKSNFTDHFYGFAVTSQENKHMREEVKNKLERIFPNKFICAILAVGTSLYAIQILSHFVYHVFLLMVPIMFYVIKAQLLYPSNF